MTLPQKESPAEGQGLDLVGSGDLNSIYGNTDQFATADDNPRKRACRLCAAFNDFENGRGECRRYAPKPDHDHAISVEWPRVAGTDFCMEFVLQGGD